MPTQKNKTPTHIGPLQGLTFVITGTLDSITREDLGDIIKSKAG